MSQFFSHLQVHKNPCNFTYSFCQFISFVRFFYILFLSCNYVLCRLYPIHLHFSIPLFNPYCNFVYGLQNVLEPILKELSRGLHMHFRYGQSMYSNTALRMPKPSKCLEMNLDLTFPHTTFSF